MSLEKVIVSPEVCEVSLDVQVQDGGGSRGAQRRAVLAQQVLELLTDLPVKQKGGEWGGELPSVSTEENRADFTLMHKAELLQNSASPHFVASTIFLRALVSLGSLCCLAKCSPTALLGNSVSQV